jgi:hypothetical protein
MQRIRLELHCSESIIDRVTNRDDSDESAAIDHGKMTKLARGHPLHDFVDCVGFVLECPVSAMGIQCRGLRQP